MKKKTLLSVLIFIVFILSPLTTFSEEGHLTILHINDVHGYILPKEPDDNDIVGGLSRIYTIVEEIAQEEDNILFLHAGDHLTGTPISTAFQGHPDVLCLNEMGLDASTIGNHEFDYTIQNFDKLVKEATFPFLSANIITEEQEARFDTYQTFDIGDFGRPVVVFGLTTTDTPVQTAPANVKGLEFLDPVPVTNKLLELWDNNYDVIITLSHLGIKTDRVLGSSVDEVDVIIGGHDHILLQEPEKVETTDVLICQAGAYAKYLGRLDLVFDKNGEISSYEYKIYPITEEIAENKKINEILKPYKEKMKEFQDKIVGNSPVYLDADRKNLRFGETNFGDLITDAMKSITNSDIALINSGGIRASVDKGDITYGDILSTFPFGNTIYKADISGDTLRKIIDYSLSKKGDGAFLQVSGLKIEYTEKDGKIEINSLEVNDEKIEPEKMYSVAIPSFVAQGGDGYSWFSEEGKNLVDTYYLLLDTVVEYLKNNNDIPEGKGRIVELE